jgi:phosphopantothenoylcysteine decarboxylase/phosphopantothenate--cysteine ligase
VKQVCDATGRVLEGKKISSRLGELQVILEAAPKLIGSLREWFPGALLVGWKYELDGTHGDVLQAGLRQIEENHTDACVLNGAAYGRGFGVCEKAGPLTHLGDEEGLFAWWAARLAGKKD